MSLIVQLLESATIGASTPTPATVTVATGLPGPQGAPGDAATIAVGSTTTLTPGSPATVQNTGTTSAAVLAFGIPAGQQGQQGIQGVPGPIGPTGPGVAPNGTTGQVLVKASNTSYDTTWATPYAGADALKTANNLSELTATAATARTNLGLGTMATQTAANYALLAGPTFTGVPSAPTATAGTNTTQIATTAFVTTAVSTKANLASPTFTGTVTIPAGASISGYALLASPTFTGSPAAPTAATATNTTQIATTAFVKNQGYIGDALSDGNYYMRRNGIWEVVYIS